MKFMYKLKIQQEIREAIVNDYKIGLSLSEL